MLVDADDVEEFYSHMNETDALYKGFGKQCVERRGDVLKYLGTAAAVRDMAALADYMEPERKEINYYGISYGTVIGATFVNSASKVCSLRSVRPDLTMQCSPAALSLTVSWVSASAADSGNTG